MDTPASQFVEIFGTAVTAMWDNKKVEMKYIKKDNGDCGSYQLEKYDGSRTGGFCAAGADAA
jgi:hypothetical protein